MDGNERSIVGVTMLAHAMVHVFELSIPVFIPIWIDAFGLTPATIGLVVSVGYGLYGLGALPGGILTDRYGSTGLILGCVVGMALSFVLLSSAPTPVLVAVALVLWGIAASVYHPAGLALISNGVRRRGMALGYHGVAGNLGIALGPLATMLLLLVLPWRQVALLLALPALVVAAVVVVTDIDEAARPAVAADGGGGSPPGPDGDGPDAESFSLSAFVANSRALFAGGFALVFGLYVLEGLYYRGTLTFLPELLTGFDLFAPVEVGGRAVDASQYLYSGLLLVGVVGQYVGGWLSDRLRPERVVAAVFAVLCLVSLAFVPAANAGLGALAGVSVVLGLFLFGLQPFMQATVAKHSPAESRGLSFGYVFAGLFGVGAVGAAITGAVLTYAGVLELFVVVGVVAAMAAGVALRLHGDSGTSE